MTKKVEYVTPVTEVLAIQYEGIVCGSADGLGAKFNNEYDDQEWD